MWDYVNEEMVVGIELEKEVGDVNEDEDNRGATTELEEVRGFKTGFDSAIQPFVLSGTSGTCWQHKSSRECLRMQRE